MQQMEAKMKKWRKGMLCLMVMALQTVYAEDSAQEEVLDKSTIAVLDLKEYYNEQTQEAFLEKVKEALHLEGFFALKNTGVNKDIVNRCYAEAKRFFKSPVELKLTADGASSNGQRGFCALGRVQAKGSSTSDFKEYYALGSESGAWDNIWPTFIDLQTPFTAYYQHMEEYGRVLEEIFSKALGEEGDFITKISMNADSSARLIYYPHDQSTFDEDAVWSREHTDIDTFTILPRATTKGLEVCDRNGNWKPVYVNEDAFIINCGDFLEAFSNGYFLSAKHRVRKPKGFKQDRYSSVFFVHTDAFAEIYPLQRWIDKVGEKRYIKANRMELLMERLADLGVATDGMLKSLADSKVLERLMTVNRASTDAMKAVEKAGYASDEVKEKLSQLRK